MHQRDICLCAKCISLLSNDDDEMRVMARISIACTKRKGRDLPVHIAPRVVKRCATLSTQ